MKTKVKDLMVLERLLLEIDLRFKFDLDFNDAYKLYDYLKTVARITNYTFLIQEEFHKKFNDTDKLKEYHSTIMESYVDFESKDIIDFIEKINSRFENAEFQNIMTDIKFWK